MKLLLMLVAVLSASELWAVGDYREFKRTCPYSDYDCRREWSEKVTSERMAAEAAERRVASQQEAARKKEEQAQRDALIEENRKKRESENQAAIERTRRDIEAWERQERAARKAAVAREKEVMERCGEDYRKPKIGMALSRAKDCVGQFRLTAQVNRADGILSTYQGSGMYIHVMEGKIVSWGRY